MLVNGNNCNFLARKQPAASVSYMGSIVRIRVVAQHHSMWLLRWPLRRGNRFRVHSQTAIAASPTNHMGTMQVG
jgi:hypothetical protein